MIATPDIHMTHDPFDEGKIDHNYVRTGRKLISYLRDQIGDSTEHCDIDIPSYEFLIQSYLENSLTSNLLSPVMIRLYRRLENHPADAGVFVYDCYDYQGVKFATEIRDALGSTTFGKSMDALTILALYNNSSKCGKVTYEEELATNSVEKLLELAELGTTQNKLAFGALNLLQLEELIME